MAGAPQQQAIIVRKKKGGGHAGHHGGAWKVAYADFTTAMMSFFLLLWLLNVTTSDQRQGIADYFAPASVSTSTSGAGGAMGGKTITSEGAQISNGSPPAPEEETVPTAGKGAEGDEDTSGKSTTSAAVNAASGDKTTGDKGQGNTAPGEKGSGEKPTVDVSDADVVAAAMRREEEYFRQAESVLKKAIQDSPELRQFGEQILIDRTSEGLRIQIVDQDKNSMFPSGSSLLFEKARDLLRLVGKVISRLPNNVSVTGHTDSSPFMIGSRRDNWTLSTERANTSRAELVGAGVAESRIARVVGLSDRDPLVPADTKDPKNRRISIVLLRQALPPVGTLTLPNPNAAPAAPAPTASPAPAPVPAAPVQKR